MATILGRLIYRKDGTDTGIDGVKVELTPAKGGPKITATTPKPGGGPGTFEFCKVAAGDYILKMPDVDGKTLVPPTDPLNLEEPRLALLQVEVKSALANVDVKDIVYVDRGGLIQGVVKPSLEDVPVTLINLDTGQERERRTDSQGHYFFDNQAPGRYSLHLEAFLEGRGLHLKTLLPPAFQLPDNGTREHNFNYEAVLGTIHGVLFLDRDGTGRRTGKNTGLSGVTVEVSSVEGKFTKTEKTEPSGDFYFEVPAGRYKVEFRQVVPETTNAVPGVKGDFELVSGPNQTVDVADGETTDLEPVAYRLEPHEIVGKVLFTGDPPRPVQGLRVALKDAAGAKEIDVAITDGEGRYRFQDVKGKHQLVFPEQPFGTQLLSRGILDADVHSIFTAPDTFYRGEISVGGSSAPAIGSVNDAVLDIASYMPTSWEVGGGAGSSGNRSGGPPDLQQIFDGALVHVLGRKAMNSDGEGFVASLNRAFSLSTVDGKKTMKWTQRAYAVQTELGAALSGAQASLYHLAKTALDDAMPLLGALYPLKPEFDRQRTEALRSIAKTEFSELVAELGAEGGPVVQRVDDLFRSLDKALDEMETEFGFDQDQINDVHEEQNLTSFLVVRHHVNGLLANWEQNTKIQLPQFLGTKLVQLSRALSSVVESVEQATSAMDAVMLGAAERQTVQILFNETVQVGNRIVPLLPDINGKPQPVPPMLVGELMNWIVRFARDEGPSLIRDGGRLGVTAIRPTSDRLQRLVLGAQQTSRVPHIGFTRDRVRRALSELAGQLENVSRHAADLEGKRQSRVQ